MFQQSATILYNDQLNSDTYRLGLQLDRPQAYRSVKPGQFVMLRIGNRHDPLLRRPFSVHRPIAAAERITGIEILYKVVGRGTALLAAARPEQRHDLLGPLGSAFLLPANARRVFIVAGGIGVAPMVFLAEHLVQRGIDPRYCSVYLGGRSADDLLCTELFEKLRMPVYRTTDDGSSGDQCLVTHPVELAVAKQRPDVLFACGPLEMLSCVVGIAEKHRIACQLSIESMMACGIGACLGCAVESRQMPDRFLHTCLDGPVFDVTEIVI